MIYNNFYIDRFFFKTMMFYDLNPNSKNVTHGEFENRKELDNYFTLSIGASFRFVITNLQDQKLVEVGAQLPQQTFNSLLSPYIHLGVGRSNNYIEAFNSATMIHNKL